MKTKKSVVKINDIYFDLIQKNIITILIVTVLSIGISFFFNSYKTLKYEYSIDIKSKNAWVSGSVIIDDLKKII